jgi:hypothetical protein
MIKPKGVGIIEIRAHERQQSNVGIILAMTSTLGFTQYKDDNKKLFGKTRFIVYVRPKFSKKTQQRNGIDEGKLQNKRCRIKNSTMKMRSYHK